MPFFFKYIVSKGVDNAVSTANWAFANSIACIALALLAPILGTFADYKNSKKKFLAVFMFLGVIFTLLLISINQGSVMGCLFIFIIARIGFAGANIFYDSFLVDITEKKRMDWVSSSGFAWGYIGGVIPLIVVTVLSLLENSHGQSGDISISSARSAFIIVALWWLVFSIPLLRDVKQKYFIKPTAHPIKESFSRLIRTFKEIRKFKPAFIFLIAYFFYIDGVDTIIIVAAAYGIDIGLSAKVLFLTIIMINVVACPFALIYGKLAKKVSNKKLLYTGISIFVLITVVSFFLPSVSSMQLKVIIFLVIGFLVATSIGGIQALSRSFFGKLIPSERSAEFFGFYNMFGKFAAFLGPLLMGIFSLLFGHSRYGILSILILLITGGILLSRVKIKN